MPPRMPDHRGVDEILETLVAHLPLDHFVAVPDHVEAGHVHLRLLQLREQSLVLRAPRYEPGDQDDELGCKPVQTSP